MSQYSVTANVRPDSLVALSATGLSALESEPPKQFGGSGERWSPEDLLVGAVADCFVLSFKAIATASKFDWTALQCDVTGTLDKIERATQFTAFQIMVTLQVPADADVDRAKRLLEKAEKTCFITNSLKAEPVLEIEIKSG